MAKLLYFYNVWNNLEVAYNEQLKKSYMTKKNFIKALIGYGKSAGGAAILENYLSDEIEKYTDEEQEQYEQLRGIFNDAYDRLKSLGNREIENFDTFMYGTINKFSLSNYRPFLQPNTVSPSEMLNNGAVYDITIHDEEDCTVKALRPYNTTQYKAFRNVNALQEFLMQNKASIEHSDFDKSIYQAMRILAKTKKLSLPLVFIEKNLFEVNNDNFIAGKFKHKCKKLSLGEQECKMLTGESFVVNAEYVMFNTGARTNTVTVIGVL